jgi:hypothetical protein
MTHRLVGNNLGLCVGLALAHHTGDEAGVAGSPGPVGLALTTTMVVNHHLGSGFHVFMERPPPSPPPFHHARWVRHFCPPPWPMAHDFMSIVDVPCSAHHTHFMVHVLGSFLHFMFCSWIVLLDISCTKANDASPMVNGCAHIF